MPRPGQHRVRQYDLDAQEPGVVVKRFDTEREARRYVELNHPRGHEVVYQGPSGRLQHYSADLAYQGDEPWIDVVTDDDAPSPATENGDDTDA